MDYACRKGSRAKNQPDSRIDYPNSDVALIELMGGQASSKRLGAPAFFGLSKYATVVIRYQIIMNEYLPQRLK